MYSSADISVTPRPMYPADGRKMPDIYSNPAELRDVLNKTFGQFPLFNFWGPKANIVSSRWIAEASKYIFTTHTPTLTLIYLPHLDYNLQRLGPDDPHLEADITAIDQICGELISYFRNRGASIIVLSEYGVHRVTAAVHINRILRENNWLRVRRELGRELLDPGASTAFAVTDHQLAHVYIQNREIIPEIKKCLEQSPGIDIVLGEKDKVGYGLNHSRSGELIALAKPDHWFSYYYWLDDNKAPDFARTVDIHRKPGYDPVELFIDPKIYFPLLKIGGKLLKKKLGFRTLLDVISLDTSLVKGSHGVVTTEQVPVFLSSEKGLVDSEHIQATAVKKLILNHIFHKF